MENRRKIDAFLQAEERYALKMAQISTGHREDALDLVQDAMISFTERYSRKEASEWKPLFYRVLQNRIVDWHRRRKVRTGLLRLFGRDEDGREAELEQTRSPEPDPEQDLSLNSAIVALESALHDLPLKQQQAVILRTWKGLDTAETAAAMGVSSGSVKTHYFRGLQKLKTVLEGYWP